MSRGLLVGVVLLAALLAAIWLLKPSPTIEQLHPSSRDEADLVINELDGYLFLEVFNLEVSPRSMASWRDDAWPGEGGYVSLTPWDLGERYPRTFARYQERIERGITITVAAFAVGFLCFFLFRWGIKSREANISVTTRQESRRLIGAWGLNLIFFAGLIASLLATMVPAESPVGLVLSIPLFVGVVIGWRLDRAKTAALKAAD